MTAAAHDRVLLATADPNHLRVLEVSLKRAGFEVLTAGTAAQALTVAGSLDPGVILSDARLPDGDALELCRRLRARGIATPLLVQARRATRDEKIAALELGIEDYLVMPVYPRELVTRLRMILQRALRGRLEAATEGQPPVEGSLAEIGMVDLVQTLEVNQRSGELGLVTSDGRAGTIWFRGGRPIDAATGRLGAAFAFFRLLSWSEGTFRLELKPVQQEATIVEDAPELLAEGMRRLDEWTRLLQELPPLSTLFVVEFRRLAERIGDLPAEVGELLRLFDGRRTLAQIIEDCEVPDLEALAVVIRLRQQGLLVEQMPALAAGDEPRARASLALWATAPGTPAPAEFDEPERRPSRPAETVRIVTPIRAAEPVAEPVRPEPVRVEPPRPAPRAEHADAPEPQRRAEVVQPPELPRRTETARPPEPRAPEPSRAVELARPAPASLVPAAPPAPSYAAADAGDPIMREALDQDLVMPARSGRLVTLGIIGGAALAVILVGTKLGRHAPAPAASAIAASVPRPAPVASPAPAPATATAAAAPVAVAPAPAAAPAAAPVPAAVPAVAPLPAGTIAATAPAAAPVAARPAVTIPVPGPAAAEPPPARTLAPAAAAAPAAEVAGAEPLKDGCRKAYADGRGKYKDAMTACRAAIEADPSDVATLVALADLEANRGRMQAALEWAQKAIAADPNAPDSYVYLGSAQQAAGRKNEARVAYQKYLELAPNGKHTAEMRAALESL